MSSERRGGRGVAVGGARLSPPKFIAAAQRTAVESRSIGPDPGVASPLL